MKPHRPGRVMWLLGFALFLSGLTCPGTSSVAAESNLSDPERQELNAYRTYVPTLIKEFNEALQAKGNSSPEMQAYREYLVEFYRQQAELQKLRTQPFNQQRLFGNWVLSLIIILSLAGVLLAAYQLYTSVRLGQKMATTGFEASLHKVQITTSAVGIAVLTVSGLLLLVFLRLVYPISAELPSPSQSTVSTKPP
jgi:hypothetical protein